MQSFRTTYGTPAVALLLALTIAACGPTTVERRLARSEARLDSFAVTLTAVTEYLQKTPGGSRPTAPDSATVSSQGAPSLGQASAPVTIVEFTDYQCPFCARHVATTLRDLRRKYIATGKIRYVIRDLPLSIHPSAHMVARAARCAAALAPERFAAFHDSLFAHQRGVSQDTVRVLAATVGLPQPAFTVCSTSDRFDAAIAADLAAAEQAGFTGTPTFVIGPTVPGDSITGVSITGAYGLGAFESAIASARSSRPGVHE